MVRQTGRVPCFYNLFPNNDPPVLHGIQPSRSAGVIDTAPKLAIVALATGSAIEVKDSDIDTVAFC